MKEEKVRSKINEIDMVAKLGRNRVVAVVESDIEIPSDLSGVGYISLDDNEWKIKLLRELRAAGLEIRI